MKINNKYEILTSTGWCNFTGVLKRGLQPVTELTIENGEKVVATEKHKFFDKNDQPIILSSLNIGEKISTVNGPQIITNKMKIDDEIVYDIIGVDNENSEFLLSHCIKTKNCDELSSVAPNMAELFMASMLPILATGGDCIITSTPGTDEDQFAKIWQGALDNTDEYGNLRPDGLGRNDFFATMVKWDEHPERDEEWARPFRQSLGEIGFAREMECVVGDTKIHIEGLQGTNVKMAIGDLYDILKMTQELTKK